MGYTTDFEGQLDIQPPLLETDRLEINEFADTRHGGNCDPHRGMPSLYCQWMCPTVDKLEWDGGEKFYSYVKWLEYLIYHKFQPKGHVLNGEIRWIGEDKMNDQGTIVVKDNVVTTKVRQ